MWETTWEIVTLVPWLLVAVAGVVMTAIRLPGTWLITAEAIFYGWWTDWERFGWRFMVFMVGLAVAGEVGEQLMSVLTARRAGASRQAAWGGLIGGFLGMFLLAFLVPVPIVGSMFGGLLGCFIGAMVAELRLRKRLSEGARVGYFSALGFVIGMVLKLAVAFVMSGALLGWIVYTTFAAPGSNPGA